MSTASPAKPELVITRIFRAPRELVWKAWTDPEQLIKWMGPRDHPAIKIEEDLRPGGIFRRKLAAGEDPGEIWFGGVYREIVEPERLVFTFAWEGDDGKPENEMLVTITFTDLGTATKMTLHQTAFRDVEQRDGHNGGWNSSFDRLEEFLAQGR